MAINPGTAKLIARIAAQFVADEETRNTAVMIILAPAIGLLLLVAYVVYITTSPLSFLAELLSPKEVNIVEDFQKDYGYNQILGQYESDYLEGKGGDYGNITFTNGKIAVVYFNQLDEKYIDKPYGTDKIGTHGSGPAALAIVISSLTGRTVDPVRISEWSVANGHWFEGCGSHHSLIPSAAKAFGLNATGNVQNSPQKIIDALKNGKLVIALMGKGSFTFAGHFIVLRGVTEDGKILVADPASKSRSEQEWDFDLILNEARKGADAGGAFWIIG